MTADLGAAPAAPAGPVPPRRERFPDPRVRAGLARAAPAVVGAVIGALVFLLVHRVLPDDSYITLNYARNLAESGHWGLLRDRPSNTATSPLNVWLLAAGTVLTGRPVVAAGALLVVTLAAAGWWADGIRRHVDCSRALPYLVVGLLGCSPLLTSTVGLETYLGAAVLLGVGHEALTGRWAATGVLVGAAVLVRPDLAVPAAIVAAAAARPSWRRVLGTAAVAALVALPWHLFAWLELGGFLPDTLWFKMGEGGWAVDGRVYHFADGWLLYGHDFTRASALSLAPALAGLAVAAVWLVVGRRRPGRRTALAFAAAGVAHWCAFAALATSPYAWYLAPSVVCLTVTACLGAAALPGPGPARLAQAAGGVLVAGTVAFLLSWPWVVGPIVFNWGTAPQYATVGTDLAEITRGQPIASAWEIGTTAYFCRCPLLDQFGDRALADRFIAERLDRAGPLTRAVARWNFAHRPATPAPDPAWRLGLGVPAGSVDAWPVWNPVREPTWGSLSRRGD